MKNLKRIVCAAFCACLVLSGCLGPETLGKRRSIIASTELQSVDLVREGLDLYARARYADAELKFRQALLLYPGAPNVRLNLALTLSVLGTYPEALKIISDLVAEDPEKLSYQLNKAKVLLASGDFEAGEALELKLLEAAKAQSDWNIATQISRDLSALAYRLGKEDEAICWSAEAVNYRPDRVELLRHVRLMGATGYFKPGLKLLLDIEPSESNVSEVGTKIQQMSEPEAVILVALLAYGDGNYPVVIRALDRILELGRGAALVAGTAQVLRDMLRHHKRVDAALLGKSGGSDEDSELSELSSIDRLAWPGNLVSDYMDFIEDNSRDD